MSVEVLPGYKLTEAGIISQLPHGLCMSILRRIAGRVERNAEY